MRYVEDLREARTPLADIFSILSDSTFSGADMQVMINGKSEEIAGGSVLDLLKAKSIEPQMVAVEVNDTMLERTHLETTQLKDGDHVEFLFYMGGGR